ncbi:hypothetical protein B0H13DRAFT_2365756 [Mycena leptocephala]|nr:hypothetical protein B0H13DRAFT_2365756 [Mycena leptocephala]
MSAALPQVHRMAKEEFSLPQQFQFDLLPSPMLSLAKMVDFTVPLVCIPTGATQPTQYFSKAAPDHGTWKLRGLWHDSESESERDSDAPLLLRRTARHAKFTFTIPVSPSQPIAPTTAAGVKRAKGHPDAPTPNPSPRKRRIYKRGANSTLRPPTPSLFSPVVACTRRRRSPDVFGSGGGYGTDSESAAEGDDDDAPLPPDSQLSKFGDSESHRSGFDTADLNGHAAAHGSDAEPADDMPGLVNVSGDDGSDSDTQSDTSGMPELEEVDDTDVEHSLDSDDDESSPSLPPIVDAAPQNPGRARPKITSLFRVETAAEKAVRLERDHASFQSAPKRPVLRGA